MLKSAALAWYLVLATLSSLPAICQQAPANDQSPSLADIAKQAKNNKTVQAKKVITDETLDTRTGPFPRLILDEDDNSAQVLKALTVYKSTHTPKETEEAFHDWFDEYNAMLTAALRDSAKTSQQRASTNYSGSQLCQQSRNYKDCQERQQAEARGAHQDQRVMLDDSQTIMHIQDSLTKVRNGMSVLGLHYDWFKIRTWGGRTY